MRWLTRIRLKRDVPAAALGRVLLPDDPSERCQTAHRLLWTLFADDPDRRRDFLWREERPGRGTSGRGGFLVLSEREPVDAQGLFDMDPPKTWAPVLAEGDRLTFSLRANPVVTRKNDEGRPKRHDVVMDRLREIPKGERAEMRDAAMREAGRTWLDRQAGEHGFAVLAEEDGDTEEKSPLLRIDGYEQLRIARRGEKPARLSVLEFDGVLEVEDADRFVSSLHRGFGKAKAWGCGLMLIRRA
jgi:CRISPR system Cascade subunit CasE